MSTVSWEAPEQHELPPTQLAEVIPLPLPLVTIELVRDQSQPKSERPEHFSPATIWAEQYFQQELGRIPLLSRAQEVELGTKIQAGKAATEALFENPDDPAIAAVVAEGEVARKEMIKGNLRLAVWVAQKWRGRSGTLEYTDVMQAANEGLINAADRYDPTRGTKFNTFAVREIKHAISRTIENEGRVIRVPVAVTKEIRALKKLWGKLSMEYGREPSTDELTQRSEGRFDKDKIEELLWVELSNPGSLDRSLGDDDDTAARTLLDIQQDDSAEDPSELFLETDDEEQATLRVQEIMSVISTLNIPMHDRVLLSLKYGIYIPDLEGVVLSGTNKKADDVIYTEELVNPKGMTSRELATMLKVKKGSMDYSLRSLSEKFFSAYRKMGTDYWEV